MNIARRFMGGIGLALVIWIPAGAIRAEGMPASGPASLTWDGSELVASSDSIVRRWSLADGLPVATSLRIGGREWLRAGKEPATTVPSHESLTPPLTIEWVTAAGRETVMEAPSTRGTLSVLGADGRGYRWHLKLFADVPAVTSRLELVGRWKPANATTTPVLAASGIEDQRAARAAALAIDRMDWLNLAPKHAELIVAELSDGTDTHDNLATERRWRLSPRERIQAATNVCAVEDPFSESGFVVLKHAPLPGSRPVRVEFDVLAAQHQFALYGHGAGAEGQGYAWSVIGYTGGKWGRARALHTLQQQLREFRTGRDGLMISNTWGDRNRDARVSERFVRTEIKAGSRLGIDVCQIDDGWQKGITHNSALKKGGAWDGGYWDHDAGFWEPRSSGFPDGLDGIAVAARDAGMGLGLWFSPDASRDFANWERDAAAVIGFHRRWGAVKVKLDGFQIHTKLAERNFRRFLDRVNGATDGAVAFDLDITAGLRPGYFGAIDTTLFLENRYTDWSNWWPHATLRNLWQLAWYVPPQRLRIEFLNATRNQEKYAGDPLAPAAYAPDYACATTLVANPLAWFEVSNLPDELAAPTGRLISTWKQHRDELQTGTILPVGDVPSGASWTGFCSVGPNATHVLVFRELTSSAEAELRLPSIPKGSVVATVAGTGTAVLTDTGIRVSIPEKLHYLWVRLSPSQ